MAREAKLFSSSSGSAVCAFFKFRANIPPRWIKNARKSRKRIEPEIVEALRSVKSIQSNRPRAHVALNNAVKQLKAVLSQWEQPTRRKIFTAASAFFWSYSETILRGCDGAHHLCLLTAFVI